MKKGKGHNGTILFLLIFFITGAVGLNLEVSRSLFLIMVPWSLVLSYLFLVAYHRSSMNAKAILAFCIIAVLGFFVETAGVFTGHIFGSYEYGKTLGLSLFSVPLLIGTNWAMLAYAAHLMMERLKGTPVWKVLLGALMMTAYDFLMEPVAVALDMWQWKDGIIPLQNYIAWFVLSVIMLAMLQAMKLKYRNPIAIALFVIQALFFGIQHLILYIRP